jgi:hypothetical protein
MELSQKHKYYSGKREGNKLRFISQWQHCAMCDIQGTVKGTCCRRIRSFRMWWKLENASITRRHVDIEMRVVG